MKRIIAFVFFLTIFSFLFLFFAPLKTYAACSNDGQICNTTTDCCTDYCDQGTTRACQNNACGCVVGDPIPPPTCIADGNVCPSGTGDKCFTNGFTCQQISGFSSGFSCQSNTGAPSGCVNGQNPSFCSGDDQCCPTSKCSDQSQCVPRPIPPGGGGGGGGGGLPPFTGTFGCGNSANEVWTLDCIFPLLKRLIEWALVFSGVVALILIIYSGIRFVTSGGDQKSVEGAKKILTYAIAGLVLVLLSFAIINLIAYATGVSCIKFMGFEACK